MFKSAARYAAHFVNNFANWYSNKLTPAAPNATQILTSSYACTLALRLALVIIFSGPPGPKFIAEALVASEKVGEGGPGDLVLLPAMVRERKERAGGMTVVRVADADGLWGARRRAKRVSKERMEEEEVTSESSASEIRENVNR